MPTITEKEDVGGGETEELEMQITIPHLLPSLSGIYECMNLCIS